MKTILLTLFMLLSACKGLNNINPNYKDRTETLKKLYLELKRDPISLNRIIQLLRNFEQDIENENITINTPINTEGIIPGMDEGEQTLMHLAVMSIEPESIELMKVLKDTMNADVNVRNHKGETPLHLACELGDKDKIRLLLEMGANINLEDVFGTTPLIAHIDGDNFSWEVFNEFLSPAHNNIKIGFELKTILHLVCDNFWKNPEAAANIMKMLAREKADFRARDIKGNTLLHNLVLASIIHDVKPNITIEMIDLLIKYDVDPKAINKDNNKTVLHLAIERKADEAVINHITRTVGEFTPSPYKIVEDRFKELIKSYGNVDVEDEGRSNIIHDTLQNLWIQEDDFDQDNTKFLKLLAALFYTRWTNDKFIPNMNSNNNVDIYGDVDKTLSLAPLINIINNINPDDIDEDLKKEHIIEGEPFDIYKVIPLFSRKIFQIHIGTYMDGRANPLTKIKFQKLVSFLPEIKDNPEKLRFVINTLLRQFANCEVAITLGLDQVFSYLGETIEENTKIEELVYKHINQLKKNTLLEALRSTYPLKDEQSHFDLQILKHFANELNLIEEYDDPYNIGDNFDPNVIRDKFYEKYTYSLIMDTSKKLLMDGKITSKLFEYIQTMSGMKNVHLVQKVFFDKNDYSSKEEFIKALLIFGGYIKKEN